jgi:hypothetical protein
MRVKSIDKIETTNWEGRKKVVREFGKKNRKKLKKRETYFFLKKEQQVFKNVQNLGLLVLFGETMKWKDTKLNFKGVDWLSFRVQSIWFK